MTSRSGNGDKFPNQIGGVSLSAGASRPGSAAGVYSDEKVLSTRRVRLRHPFAVPACPLLLHAIQALLSFDKQIVQSNPTVGARNRCAHFDPGDCADDAQDGLKVADGAASDDPGLTRKQVQVLQATLYELSEIKRIVDEGGD